MYNIHKNDLDGVKDSQGNVDFKAITALELGRLKLNFRLKI